MFSFCTLNWFVSGGSESRNLFPKEFCTTAAAANFSKCPLGIGAVNGTESAPRPNHTKTESESWRLIFCVLSSLKVNLAQGTRCR